MPVNKFCPICEEYREVSKIKSKEDIKVRGEMFSVNAHYYSCPDCGEEFEISNNGYDPVAEAYQMYRKKNSMLFPGQIKEFRHKYELTQKELSALLGWGAVTLSRYENGALQDLCHDRELQEANTPDGLLKLIELTPDALKREKRERLRRILSFERDSRNSILHKLESSLSSILPGIMNGFQRFNLEKYFGVVEFFCSSGGMLKTKLNKLLYYSDFIHYRDYQHSITGAQYASLPFGPCPNDYKKLLAVLEEDLCILETEEVTYNDSEHVGERLVARSTDNIEVLSADEIATLEQVRALFGLMSSTQITDASHKEKDGLPPRLQS